jgi:membrane protein
VFGNSAVNGQLATQLTDTLGSSAAETIQNLIAHTYQSDRTGIGVIVGVIVLILAASSLFGQLRSSFNQIFQVESDPQAKLHGLIWPRLKGLLLLAVVSLFTVVSIAASALLAAIIRQAQTQLGAPHWLLEAINFGASAVVVGLLLGLLYRGVPDVIVPRRVALCAGLIVGLLFSIGKTVLGLVIGGNATASAYGAAASLIVLLLWVYYFAQILFIGAEWIKIYADRRGFSLLPKRYHVKQKTLDTNLETCRTGPVHGEIEAFPISACLQTEVILGHIGASLKLIISVITIYTVAI